MKPRIFFDTNIMLDLIQERPGYEACAQILQHQEDGEIEVCLSVLSMANIAYVLRKTVPPFLVIPTLKQISSVVRIVPMDDAQLQQSLLMDGPDFEDILQLTCAIANDCTVLITHNPRDFRIRKGLATAASLPEILTPEDFLTA
jgi:predicted nucleic acid-binding protein